MLKYFKKFENNRPALLPTHPTHQNSPCAEVTFFNTGEFKKGDKKPAPAFRFNNYEVCFGVNRWGNGTQSNLVYVCERKMPRCEPRRVLDHHFNVR